MTKFKTRAVVITPLGHRILDAVAKGTYHFAKGGKLRAGQRIKKQRWAK